MKDRITINGTRIILAHIVKYCSFKETAHSLARVQIYEVGRSDPKEFSFASNKEKDAFLERLDNYFKEIP